MSVAAAPFLKRESILVLRVHAAPRVEGSMWTMKVDMYLGVFNDSSRFTLPVNANDLYQGQADPTQLFTRMALQVLGEKYVRRMPISYKFKALLGPAYASDGGEATSEEGEESSQEERSSSEEED